MSAQPVTPSSPQPAAAAEITVVGLLALVLRRRALLVLVTLSIVLLTIVVAAVIPDAFTANSVFLPNVGSQPVSRLGGLAADLGITTRSAGEPPQLYVELVGSHQLLKSVAETEFTSMGQAGPLQDLLALADSPDERLTKTVRWLQDHVKVTPDPVSSLIRLSVDAPTPELAEGINRRILTLINEFNIARRRELATADRSFVESRVAEARSALESAENSLQRFLDANRRIEDSPDLLFERQRRQRNIELQQQLYTSLVTSYEQAKIDEVRSTPVVTVVDGPEESARESGRRLRVIIAASLVLGLGVAITLVLALEYVAYLKANHPDDVTTLTEAWGHPHQKRIPPAHLPAERSSDQTADGARGRLRGD